MQVRLRKQTGRLGTEKQTSRVPTRVESDEPRQPVAILPWRRAPGDRSSSEQPMPLQCSLRSHWLLRTVSLPSMILKRGDEKERQIEAFLPVKGLGAPKCSGDTEPSESTIILFLTNVLRW